jgi:hypothetical protein
MIMLVNNSKYPNFTHYFHAAHEMTQEASKDLSAPARTLHGLLFDPEDAGSSFLRSAG